MDQLRDHAAHGFDAERKRRDVEQQLVFHRRPTESPACTAAPSATTSSGFSSVCGRARNSSSTAERTSGMRVDPPTITTSSICSTVTPASLMQSRQGPSVRSTIGVISLSNSSRVISRWYFLPRYSSSMVGGGHEGELLLGVDHGAPQQLHRLRCLATDPRPIRLRRLRARCAAADCRYRRRPGACRRWWPALRRCRRAA